jgi:hypothetical protein
MQFQPLELSLEPMVALPSVQASFNFCTPQPIPQSSIRSSLLGGHVVA